LNIKGSTISHIRGISYREPYRKKEEEEEEEEVKPSFVTVLLELFMVGFTRWKTGIYSRKETRALLWSQRPG